MSIQPKSIIYGFSLSYHITIRFYDSVSYLNRIQEQREVIKVVYMTFLLCLVSLMMGLYTSAETCCSKTL